MKQRRAITMLAVALLLVACKKPEQNHPELAVSDLQQRVLEDYAEYVAFSTYNELRIRVIDLEVCISNLYSNGTDAGLDSCKKAWRSAIEIWERSKACSFGPAGYLDMNRRIDSWPIDVNAIELALDLWPGFENVEPDSLPDSIKGFHTIEYILFGNDGDNAMVDLELSEIEYMQIVATEISLLANQLKEQWNANVSDSFANAFINAGNQSMIYSNRLSAYQEMVNAMIGICDDVANAKMAEPLVAQDPSLVESPFSKNSLNDFTSNLHGVKAAYMGNYHENASGLEDLVRQSNLQLDVEIKQKMETALLSLSVITLPFDEAIVEQPIQVQLAVDAINELAVVLENGLMPFIQATVQ